MVLKGSVEHIIYANEENGYCIFDIVSDNELITVTGAFPGLCEGEELTLTGEYTMNPKYGRQFNATEGERKVPADEYALSRYLGSGLIKGVGPVTAAAIVEKFGAKTVQVIENSPHFLSQIKGISKAKAQEIGKAFAEVRRMQAAMLFLQKYEISLNLSIKIFNEYGDDTEKLLKENPYRLVEEIEGVGFITADKIAVKLGVEPESQYRLRAAISYILDNGAQTNGNTYLPEPLLVEGLKNLLRVDIDEDSYISAKKDLIIDKRIKQLQKDDFAAIALNKYYAAEKSIAGRLMRLQSGFTQVRLDIDDEITDYERLHNMQFAGKQREAVKAAVNDGVAVITGGPGTGKTTIVKCILSVLKKQGCTVLLCAPTGRAAKRLALATGDEAKTIHRTLEIDFTKGGGGSSFVYNDRNPLEAACIIVDEVSMVDAFLMSALLKAVRQGARLILVGDKDQLPSVGAGNVLADILASEKIPATYLDTIFRQAESSQIVVNAHNINKGLMPELNKKDSDFFFSPQESGQDILNTVLQMCTRRIPEFLDIEPFSVQVLAPMKNGPCGIDNINAGLQGLLNPPSPVKREIPVYENMFFRKGDKVMQTVNNYRIEWQRQGRGFADSGQGVFNGDIGIISDITEDNETLVMFEDDKVVKYTRQELNQLTLAYAITIHKSQGCEFDVVVMPVISGSYMILTRNLLYTAVTRAKRMCVLVGSRENIGKMVRNNYTAERYTLLKDLISEEAQKLDMF